jgi:hypothetical protein
VTSTHVLCLFDCTAAVFIENFFGTRLQIVEFNWEHIGLNMRKAGGDGDGWSRSDVEAGGETVFPASQVNSSLVADWDELTECAKAGLSVRPRMGDALLFWSMKPDASLDASSLHGGHSSLLSRNS